MNIPGPLRHDFRFPLRINGAQRQAKPAYGAFEDFSNCLPPE